MNIHKMKKGRGEHYPLEIVDIMGIESTQGGIKKEDIIKAFEGHILDEYKVSTQTFANALSFPFINILFPACKES